ncbi:hypothetical protein PVW47_01360 [Marinovum sp. SP66]|uniref:hypothetical protein n=1 Tax=Marinovum TaxID=367771 RepID=UPI00237C0824|nr:hypothetical protein [Marinovum sp. SP66]MDD9738420.1 hypothetical protein [Marinovum sp. SP66]
MLETTETPRAVWRGNPVQSDHQPDPERIVALLDEILALAASATDLSLVTGALSWQGVWDADANSPAIPAAAAGNSGHVYWVGTAGSTALDGISDWAVGDYIVSDGSEWSRIRIDVGVVSVAGKAGAVVIEAADIDDSTAAGRALLTAADAAAQRAALALAAVASSGDSDDLTEGATNLLMTTAERTKLAGIEAAATADQTGAEIKAAYEAEDDTNAFTDEEKAKLASVAAGATKAAQSDRPGDNPDAFSATYTGEGADKTPLSGGAAVSGAGLAYVQAGAGIVAARNPVALNNDVIEFTARFRRTSNPADPNNHGILLRVAWLDEDKALIGSVATLATKSDALTSSGLVELSARVSALAVEDVTAPPSGTIYACPFIQTYGDDGTTAIETLRTTEVTDLHVLESADLSQLIADAEAATAAANTAADLVATETLDTMADVALYTRAAGVGSVVLKGGYSRGDGLGGSWVYDPDGIEVTASPPELLIGADGDNYRMASANLVYRSKPDLATLAAATDIAEGQTVRVTSGDNNEPEIFISVPASTYTANGSTVIDGVSVQFVSTRMKCTSAPEVFADTRGYSHVPVGTKITGGDFAYEVKVLGTAEGGATGYHKANASGVLLRVIPHDDFGWHVDAFGAAGDGSTLDRLAIYTASQAIQAAGGGKLTFGQGKTYIIGEQTFTGDTTDSRAYAYLKNIFIEGGGTGNYVIEGNGSILKFADGLAFGAHDPVTGAAAASETQGINNRSDIGFAIYVASCDSIVIRDLEIDGNMANLSLGASGTYSSQGDHDGIRLSSNKASLVQNVYSHHCCRDGVYTARGGTAYGDPAWPVLLQSVHSEYNGRQGWSHVGGVSAMAQSCSFSFTGRGGWSSAPGAGVDIEPTSSLNVSVQLVECHLLENAGISFAANSGDSFHVKMTGGMIVALDNYALRVDKPGFVFEDVVIVGVVLVGAGSANPHDATRFIRGVITDNTAKYYNGNPVTFAASHLVNSGTVGSGHNVLYERTVIDAQRYTLGYFTDGAILDRVHFIYRGGTEWLGNKAAVLQYGGGTNPGKMISCTIIDDIQGTRPVDGYFVNFRNIAVDAMIGANNIISATGSIRWKSWSTGAGGHTGVRIEQYNDVPQPVVEQLLMYLGNFERRGDYYQRVFYWSGAPADGSAVRVGDIVFNRSAGAGGKAAFFCTVAGDLGSTAVLNPWGAIDS